MAREAYAVLRIVKELDLNTGLKVNCAGMDGCRGMMPVFESREAAEEIYGPGIDLMPLLIGED